MEYSVIKLLNRFSVKEDGYKFHYDPLWLYCINDKQILPNQGWKIHLSFLPSEFNESFANAYPVICKYQASLRYPSKSMPFWI